MSLRQNVDLSIRTSLEFSYQSECHCAKTYGASKPIQESLVTSQNVTAPKPLGVFFMRYSSLVTSQNVTAPKQVVWLLCSGSRLVTSQNVTAPKHVLYPPFFVPGLVTSQNVTAPKPSKEVSV